MFRNLCYVTVLSLLLSLPIYSQKKEFTKEDYQKAAAYSSRELNTLILNGRVNPSWLDNGNFWYKADTSSGEKFILVNSKSGKKSTYDKLEDIPGYRASVFRQASRTEVVSPDGNKSAFIKNWNLWVRYLDSGKEVQLTNDGIENYGYATDNAGWRKSDKPILLWSPDSKKIATYQQDQRHVSDMYLVTTNPGAPTLQQWKYPLPQDEKVIQIERVIIEVDQPKVIRLKMPADPRRGTLCDDISCSGAFDDNEWSEDATRLYFVSSSRDHKSATMRVADASNGAVRDIFNETVTTQYESGQGSINWAYLDKSDEIIWFSERDDWGHLYMYDAKNGNMKHQITKGSFALMEISFIDETNNKIYALVNGFNPNENPYYSHLISVDFNGKNLKDLTPEVGNHSISWSANHDFFVDNYSTPVTPNKAVLKNTNGKIIQQLERADLSKLKEGNWKAPEIITVKSAIGDWDLYGLMFTPSTLDPNKKYPIVNYVYPGPQGGSMGSWSFSAVRRDHQALAELGFIVIVLEGSCNPGRSKSFHDSCYGSLAENTLPDQISGIKQLAETRSYFDLDRVGIWGHSGGGSATVAALFKYPEFYKVGVAQSGNHDSRSYEDDWGERYIGLMKMNDDGTSNYGFEANAEFATNLKGHLLLAHGAMDDNVPPYHTFLVVDALVKANKDFDLIIYPHARHGYGDDNKYMQGKRWNYFVEHLLNAKPPIDFVVKN